jgi:hypothetical protein
LRGWIAPGWPGGSSGVTIGIGYDLGYVTVDQFESDWGECLSFAQIENLRGVVGLRSIRAKNKITNFSHIKIKWPDAEKVFIERTFPLTQLKTEYAFPDINELPLDAQGALVSLVYNRGALMVDNSPPKTVGEKCGLSGTP